MTAARSRPGLTLVEVLAALALLSIGVLSVAAAAGVTGRLHRVAAGEQDAALAAATVLDSLAQLAHPMSGSALDGRFLMRWTCADSGDVTRVLLTARYTDGSGIAARTFETLTGAAPIDAP